MTPSLKREQRSYSLERVVSSEGAGYLPTYPFPPEAMNNPEHVRRLDVSVENLTSMKVQQHVADLNHDSLHCPFGKALVWYQGRQVAPGLIVKQHPQARFATNLQIVKSVCLCCDER